MGVALTTKQINKEDKSVCIYNSIFSEYLIQASNRDNFVTKQNMNKYVCVRLMSNMDVWGSCYKEYIIEKRVSNFHIRTLSKMSPLSNSVYSSVFTYNPNVLMRQYQHLTTKALIEPHHITCVSLDISVLIVRFGDQARVCRVDTPTSHQKRTHHP